MASSVELRACGGIGPYSWSKTGGVILSATEGIQITVTADGAGSQAADSITIGGKHLAAYIKLHAFADFVDVGSCGSGTREYDWNVNTSGAGAYVEGFNCAQQSLGTNYAFPRSGNCFAGSNNDPWVIDGSGTTLVRSGSSTGACNGSQDDSATPSDQSFGFTGTGLCCVDAPTMTLTMKLNPVSPAVNSTSVENSHTIALGFSGLKDSPLLDVRTQCMIDTGCAPCDPTGATVTVTDDAGVSVTYTF